MGQRTIRLDDDVYTDTKEMARIDGRSHANMVNHMLRMAINTAPPEKSEEAVPRDVFRDGLGLNVGDTAPKCCYQSTRCKHWEWDAVEGWWYNPKTNEIRAV